MITSFNVSDKTWWKWIIIGWIVLISYSNINSFLPSSYWMTVSSVYVSDTNVGTSPPMLVTRSIFRPFTADWIVEVEEFRDGYFTLIPECSGKDRNNYSSENKLPIDLDLEWWSGKLCHLYPGRYRVETTWTFLGKSIREVSNIFTITTKEGDGE